MINILGQFIYLQVLDMLTTLAFMAGGVAEANPVVRVLVDFAGSPLGGLLAAKFIALSLAAYCWRSGRRQMLSRINVFYAVLVAWNLVAFLAATAAVA